MDHYLSVSRAARVVGVKRGTLQKRIQDGDIQTFEGMLSLDELLKVYPKTELEDNTMIERSKSIKDAAMYKSTPETVFLPSFEVLAHRARKLSNELLETRALANKYVELVENIKESLDDVNYSELNEIKSKINKAVNTPIEVNLQSKDLAATDNLLRLMTSHVRILPSGHDFFVEGKFNLLEAGLRSGLALDYGCSNGQCGKCLATLISGDVSKIDQSDFVLSDAQKASGQLLMCCHAAITDVVLEAHEAGNANEIPKQQIVAKVKKIDAPTENVRMLHLKTPRTKRLRFLAGQFVTLGGDKGTPIGEHPISSCPCDDMNLHFQIPRLSDDTFSDYVFNTLKNGDNLMINGPSGEFILREGSNRSVVFIAYGTGFSPVKSLIEHAMALDVSESMYLFWISTNDEDRYLGNLCRSWQDALDNFTYIPVTANISNGSAKANQQLIEKMIGHLDDITNNDYYVAGNAHTIDACREVLLNTGVPEKQFIADSVHYD